jgi:hypothetical protein
MRCTWLLSRAFLVPALILGSPHGESSDLRMVAVSSFGDPLTSCRVESFRASPAVPGMPQEYAGRFLGLTAKGIPFGRYEAFLRCSEGRLHAVIALDQSDQFEVVPRNERLIIGERGAPKLVISLDAPRPMREIWWVRLVGLYNQSNSTSEFSASTAAANFDAPDPGSYLVTIISTAGYQCIKGVELVEDTRHWVFHSSSCHFEFDRYAHQIEATDAGGQRKSVWYRQMQKDRDAFFRMLEDSGKKK